MEKPNAAQKSLATDLGAYRLPDPPGAAPGRPAGSRATRVDRQLLRSLCRRIGNPPLEVQFWDGQILRSDQPPRYRLRLADRGALLRLLTHAQLYFGDLYATGRIEFEGDLSEFLSAVFRHISIDPGHGLASRLASLRDKLLAPRNNPHDNIPFHYDIGNDFYRLWLDPAHMQYTCAYFPEPTMTLAAAQTAKLHHVCRKLQLRPGQTVVEAGSGWGGLARFMAREYGVRVRAYNISPAQIRYAREQTDREGLGDKVEYVEADWREIHGQYDAFVSVGMLEHLGRDAYHGLAGIVERSLKPGGRGLIHSIGRIRPTRFNPWIERRIFPGAYPPTLAEMAALFEPTRLSIRDVENLRPHYALTLEHWLANFERQAERITADFGPAFVRAWRLYLAGSIAAFASGQLHLFQLVFSPVDDPEPWSRAFMYAKPGEAREPR